MTPEELKLLKKDENIKFIYRIPSSIFEEKFEYIIIGLLETRTEENVRYFNIDDWFLLMKSGSILPYVCATSLKKHKIKEFLNIYDKPDMLKLRKYVLRTEDNKIVAQECAWAIQYLEEGKINRPDIFFKPVYKPAVLNKFLKMVEPMFKSSLENEVH